MILEQSSVRNSGFESFRFMSYAMKIKYFAFACLLIASSTNFAQEKGQEKLSQSSNMETKPTNCEYNGATLNFVHREAAEDGLIIAIARLGKGEQKRAISRQRLRKVRRYLVENWQRVSDTIVTAEGERVEGYGRIELYVGGKLRSTILVERNRDLAADSCQGGELKYTGGK